MRYLVSLILPPLGILICGKPFQALLNLILCIVGIFVWPVLIACGLHGLLVAHAYYADKRMNRLIAALKPGQEVTGKSQKPQHIPWYVWAFLTAVILLILMMITVMSGCADPPPYLVRRVIDGDTIEVTDGACPNPPASPSRRNTGWNEKKLLPWELVEPSHHWSFFSRIALACR